MWTVAGDGMGAGLRIVGTDRKLVPEEDRLLWIEQQASLLCGDRLSDETRPVLMSALIDCVSRERNLAQLLLRRIVEYIGGFAGGTGSTDAGVPGTANFPFPLGRRTTPAPMSSCRSRPLDRAVPRPAS